jgi:hypothetical protein
VYDAAVRSALIACLLVAGAAGSARIAHADARQDRHAAEQVCAARDPKCDWLATLSALERASVRRALTRRGYTVEPSPWGKVIGRVHVYNEDVFAEKSRFLQFFNNFHVTTRERAILKETVIGAGEVWDQERVEETARRLRDPLWSSVIAAVPVMSAEPGKVDLLVVTRDIWSLRLNTQYLFQEGKLTNLSISLSENNFLGTRSVLAAAVTMDQGTLATGPLFIDKNLFGQHVELRARVDAVLNRDDLLQRGTWSREGSQSTIALSRNLWSLASKWGAGVTFTHRYAIDRSFVGTNLRQVRCPLDGADCLTGGFNPAEVPDEEKLPYIYEMRRWGVSSHAVRQFGGKALKQQLTLGHSVDSQRPRVLDSFAGTPEQRGPFERAVLPRSEVASVPFVAYTFFTPRFKTLRNVSTFDLAEDVRFGPDLDVSYGVGLEVLGSDDNFQRGSAAFSWTVPWCRDGFVRPILGASTRRQDGEWIDNTSQLTLRAVSPTYWYARLVSQLIIATRWNDASNRFFTIGSDDGLRGFSINEFSGQRLVRGNFELRSIPLPIWVFRVGTVLFYDVGGAANSFGNLRLNHDVGLGFRMLIPQTSRELFRFDLAIPVNDGARTRAGSPAFIAGFESAF